jgi:hypothetical protein
VAAADEQLVDLVRDGVGEPEQEGWKLRAERTEEQ